MPKRIRTRERRDAPLSWLVACGVPSAVAEAEDFMDGMPSSAVQKRKVVAMKQSSRSGVPSFQETRFRTHLIVLKIAVIISLAYVVCGYLYAPGYGSIRPLYPGVSETEANWRQ